MTPYFMIGQPDPKANMINTSRKIALGGMEVFSGLEDTRAPFGTGRRTIGKSRLGTIALGG